MGKELFNSIAEVYGWFHGYQARRFAAILDRHAPRIGMAGMRTICDVGCGTGALCSVLAMRGHEVTGVDPAQRMLAVAKRKAPSDSITFVRGDAVEGLPFSDHAFDLVITSHVAHGMRSEKRKLFYRELMRIADKAVIIHDYNEERAVLTTFVEWMEKGDYFGFIKRPKEEMEEVFPSIETIDVGKQARWYVCRCPEPLR